MKNKKTPQKKITSLSKSNIVVQNEPQRGIQQLLKIQERERFSSKKQTFFQNVFDSKEAKPRYENYVHRLEMLSKNNVDFLNRLSVYTDYLIKYRKLYHDKKEALFPNKLAFGKRGETNLITAKRNVERIMASPAYQAYQKQEEHYQTLLSLTLFKMESLKAELDNNDLARRANGIESQFIYS